MPIRLASVLLMMVSLLFLPGCPPDPLDGEDPDQDDDTGLDDVDDSTPLYEGDMCVGEHQLEASCEIAVPADGKMGEGLFSFEVTLDGWAEAMWIELWDLESEYCEGYDPVSGEPCDFTESPRPGWDMVNTDFGWDEVDGFWDDWERTLPYLGDIYEASTQEGVSAFVCEGAGETFETWFCGVDFATDVTCCAEYPLTEW